MQTATPPCPACGALTVRRMGVGGPFLGCSTYPLCRHASDLDSDPREHPIARTRRLALRWLKRMGPWWTDDDRADAIGDALVSAMQSGWAARPEAWRFVALKARRALRGWARDRGPNGQLRYRSFKSRAGARPIATPAMRLGDESVAPSDWIEETRTEPASQETAVIAASYEAAGITSGAAAVRVLDAQGWTSEEISQRLSIPLDSLRKYRAGRNVRNPRTAARLVELAATGCDFSDRAPRWSPPTIGDVWSPLAVVKVLFGPGLLACARQATVPVAEERATLMQLLEMTGSTKALARLLGVDRSTAHRRLAAAGLARPGGSRAKRPSLDQNP